VPGELRPPAELALERGLSGRSTLGLRTRLRHLSAAVDELWWWWWLLVAPPTLLLAALDVGPLLATDDELLPPLAAPPPAPDALLLCRAEDDAAVVLSGDDLAPLAGEIGSYWWDKTWFRQNRRVWGF